MANPEFLKPYDIDHDRLGDFVQGVSKQNLAIADTNDLWDEQMNGEQVSAHSAAAEPDPTAETAGDTIDTNPTVATSETREEWLQLLRDEQVGAVNELQSLWDSNPDIIESIVVVNGLAHVAAAQSAREQHEGEDSLARHQQEFDEYERGLKEKFDAGNAGTLAILKSVNTNGQNNPILDGLWTLFAGSQFVDRKKELASIAARVDELRADADRAAEHLLDVDKFVAEFFSWTIPTTFAAEVGQKALEATFTLDNMTYDFGTSPHKTSGDADINCFYGRKIGATELAFSYFMTHIGDVVTAKELSQFMYAEEMANGTLTAEHARNLATYIAKSSAVPLNRMLNNEGYTLRRGMRHYVSRNDNGVLVVTARTRIYVVEPLSNEKAHSEASSPVSTDNTEYYDEYK